MGLGKSRQKTMDEELWEGISFFVAAGMEGEMVVEAAMGDQTFHDKFIKTAENR